MKWDFTGMSRPGPGVDPGAPRKTGLARFWEMLSRDFGSLLGANLLCFVTFLPAALVTSLGLIYENFWITLIGGLAGGALAGPFYAALADTVLRTLQDDPSGWWDRWRHALGKFWRPAALTGLVLGVLIAAFLFVGNFFVAAMKLGELPALPVWLMLGVDFLLLSLFGVTLPFQIILGREGFAARLKDGALLLLHHPARVAAAAVFQLLWWALVLALFPVSVLFAIPIGFWPAALINRADSLPGAVQPLPHPGIPPRPFRPDGRPLQPGPAVGDLVAAALGLGDCRRGGDQLRAGHRLHLCQPVGAGFWRWRWSPPSSCPTR